MVCDTELLRQYSESGAEPQFTELVQRHINLVYFTALRRTGGDTALAQDIVQSVFATAARKASNLVNHVSLTGWLYTTTRNIAAKAVRKEQTRRHYENLAAMDTLTGTEPSAEWERLRPIIDGVLGEMPVADREAILIRFFQGRSYVDMSAMLQISEDAARMRLERALERLRRLLQRRGIRSAAAALAVALSAQGGLAVPVGMVATVSSGAIATVTATSGTAVFFGFMSLTKTTAIAASLAATIATGIAVFERNLARKAEAELTAMTRNQIALQASLARVETQLSHAQSRADEADRDTANLLAAIETSQRQASQQARASVEQTQPHPEDPLTRSLEAIFPNGIVAIVGDKTITVAEIRRGLVPQLPKIQAEARDDDELGHRLNRLQNAAIKDAVERILLVKEFRNEKMSMAPRQIAPAFVDQEMAEVLNTQFGNDTAKLTAFLKSRGVTAEQYRQDVEDRIAYGFMKQQQRKLDREAQQAKAR